MKLLFVCMLFSSAIFAQTFGRPAVLKGVGLDQQMGAQIPLDLQFTDESGQPVALREFSGKPMILALVYYQCPSLCNMILEGVLRGVRLQKFTAGQEFNVVAVSFDPHETFEMAASKKRAYLKEYNRPGTENGWHFLTGREEASKALADSVGFHYSYDNATKQYVHPSAITILTPEGRVSSYFYGINYAPRDVRLALVEASNRKIGTRVDEVMLYCFHYDPSQGKYGFAIMSILRAAGIATVGLLAAFVIFSVRRERRMA